MDEPRKHLKSGMFWLGSSNLFAQIVDVISLVAVLAFLTEADLGVATLSWSLAVLVESFNGMGTGSSLLQAREVDRDEIDSIFWYATILSVVLCALLSLGAPWIAEYYHAPELTPMIIVAALKLPLVSIALVPLQLLNRSLRFKDISLIQTSSTLLSATLKILLAVAGAGAWALVIANAAYGLFTLIGALLRQPYMPRFFFSWTKLRKHVLYGAKIAASGVTTNLYRNADYMIVGKVFGKEVLGLYRVAFDIAMTPPLTVLAAVNRTAFPVFSRIQENRVELASTLSWIQRGLAYLAAPIAVFLTFAGPDLLGQFHDGRWTHVAPILTILAWAAVPRCISHVFPELFKAVGRPGLAVYHAVSGLVLIVGGLLGVTALCGSRFGLAPVAWTWLVATVLIVFYLLHMTKPLIPITVVAWLQAYKHPAYATCASVIVAWGLSSLRQSLPATPWVAWPFMLILAASIIGVFWAYLRLVLRLSLDEILGRKSAKSA